MKKTFLAVLSAAVITVGAIGGVALASNVNDNSAIDDQQTAVADSGSETNQVTPENNSDNTNYNQNSANNPSKDMHQGMVKLMRDNGFKDAARYMQTGDVDAMKDYMSNLSEEDFDKMIEIMNENGYGHMGQMMDTIGIDGMTEMHDSMGNGTMGGNGGNTMMGQF